MLTLRKYLLMKSNFIKPDKNNHLSYTRYHFDIDIRNYFDYFNSLFLSDKELSNIEKIEQLEMQEEKADAQRRMAWISLLSMIVFTLLVFMPIFPDSRIKACLLYTSPSPRDLSTSRMPSCA